MIFFFVEIDLALANNKICPNEGRHRVHHHMFTYDLK